MREIKFRGRDSELFLWRYGDLDTKSSPDLVSIIEDCDYAVDPDTVGQFTGLCDVDGQEIYEGDILSNGRDTVSVSYSIEFAAFVGLYNGREDLVLNLDDCIDQPLDELKLKVVGNVYDNPNLLEVAHD